jgi:hypothetical protein
MSRSADRPLSPEFARRHRLVGGVAAALTVLVPGAGRAGRPSGPAAPRRPRPRPTARPPPSPPRRRAMKRSRPSAGRCGVRAWERDRAVAERTRGHRVGDRQGGQRIPPENLFEQVTGGAQRGTTAPDLSVSGALDRAAANVGGTFRGELGGSGRPRSVARLCRPLLFDQVQDPARPRSRAGAPRARPIQRVKGRAMLPPYLARTPRRRRNCSNVVAPARAPRNTDGDAAVPVRPRRDLLVDGKPEGRGAAAPAAGRRALGPDHRDTITALTLVSSSTSRARTSRTPSKATQAAEQARRALGAHDVLTPARSSNASSLGHPQSPPIAPPAQSSGAARTTTAPGDPLPS